MTQPCEVCMSACNNGHFWMFHDESVSSQDRVDKEEGKVLIWAKLPLVEGESEQKQRIACSR